MQKPILLSILLLSALLTLAQTATSPGEKRDPARSEPGAAGQKDPAPAKPAPPTAKPADIPADAPVITLKGVCPAGAAQQNSANCQTTVTRAQFELLVDAVNPDMPPEMRERFAQNYGRLLVVAAEARKAGVDKLPSTNQLYEFAKMQVLAQQLGKKLQDEASKVPETEVEAYYKQHQKDFDEVELERLIIPRGGNNASTAKDKPAPSEAEERAAAEKFRARWLAGEDPLKLQQEAYRNLPADSSLPPIDIGARRRSGLPQTQQAVFDLKAGEISQVFVDPAAFFIFKVKEKDTKPLAEVREDIKKTLMGERLQKSMERVTSAAEASLNQTYFGPSASPVSAEREKSPVPNPGRRVPGTPPSRPPAKTAPATTAAPAAPPK